ncbi:IS200/IS605 family transposase [Thermodesulfobacteriota bacterium]
MKIRLSGHVSYHHEFHIVWIPKYRKKILKGKLRSSIEKHLYDVQDYHHDVEIEKYSIQIDHVHLIIIIPQRYSVSRIIREIKANTSREVRKKFEWVKKVYWRNEFWSPGFFSSTVGIDEEVIKRYVEFQEKVDTHGLTPVALCKGFNHILALAFTHGFTPVVLC